MYGENVITIRMAMCKFV